MKKTLIIAGIIALVLAGIAVSKDAIIKSAVTAAASKVTGTRVHISRFSLDIFTSTIRISGFTMYNPSGFPEGILVSCPEIKVIYDRATLFKEKRHFLVIEVELKEMGLTKNKEGKLNVDALEIVRKSKGSPPTPMQIDLLNLSIGRIVYKEYGAGAEPSVRVFEVNKKKSYKGVPTAQQLALLVLAEPMKSAAIKNAEIYGAAMLTGVAVLPVAVAATFIGRDYVQQSIDMPFERVYEKSLAGLKRMGRITKQSPLEGAIKADVNGAAVALQLRRKEGNKTEITVSARKYMLPKPDIAGGVLYQILDAL